LSWIDKTFLKFCVVGLLNTSVNYLIFLVTIKITASSVYIAGALGFMSGAILGFVLNRRYSFKSNVSLVAGGATYLAIQLFCLLIHFLVQVASVNILEFEVEWTQLPGILVTTIVNYALSKQFVFKTQGVS
tara:strand:+ start:814 stop:1206 length:393 start_codon:yes stop_codon:yes gene_type:complete